MDNMEYPTIKYYDVNDNEIQASEIDYDLGYIEHETKVIKHHEAEPAQLEQNHYEVDIFYFDDGTTLKVESQDDPHIKKINPEKGIFGYEDQGEGKILKGIDLKTVVDKESSPAKEAWDETESFFRYKLFTPEQIAEKKAQNEKEQKEKHFMETGPERLEVTEANVENLGLDVGDLSVTLVEIIENL